MMRVVTVCGNQATIWSKQNKQGGRSILRVRSFNNHGQAKEFAREYEEAEKARLDE